MRTSRATDQLAFGLRCTQLTATFRQGDHLAALDLGQASFQRGESLGIGEDLGGLLKRLVLVDRG